MWKRTIDTTSFSLYIKSKSNKSRDVKFRTVISITPNPPPSPCPVNSRPSSLLYLPPTLGRGDRNCVIILATLLKCNISWRKIIECIQLYKQINQCYSASKFFWLNSHNSWSFILQRFTSSIASFLTKYRISRFLIFFCKLGLMKTKIHVDGPQKEIFFISNGRKEG